MTKDLDALPLPEIDIEWFTCNPNSSDILESIHEHIRAARREGYELAKREAREHESMRANTGVPEGCVPVAVYNEAMQSLAKAVEERDALRKAQEGREPVGFLWRQRGSESRWTFCDDIKQLPDVAMNAFINTETRVVYDSPPPKSDTRMIERLKSAIEGECDGLAISDQHAKAILEYVLDDVLAPKSDEAMDALRLARPYVADAYEAAFPDEDQNASVLAAIDAALAAQQKGGA